jgi:hypothetical protein
MAHYGTQKGGGRKKWLAGLMTVCAMSRMWGGECDGYRSFAAIHRRRSARRGRAWIGSGIGVIERRDSRLVAPATLLTKCLPGREKRRLGPSRPHVFVPKWQTRAVAAGSRHAQEARIMAISRVFSGTVNLVNSFP